MTELRAKIENICNSPSAIRISEDKIKEVNNLTDVKEIYADWESNDMGEDFTLYTGSSSSGKARYFLRHYLRDWFGGWTSDDYVMWYEITESVYNILYKSSSNNN